MPVREFDTGFWGNPDIRKLPTAGKTLAAYVFTNADCSAAGLYETSPDTIAFDTGIPREELNDLFKLLEPGVMWYPEKNLIWVRNFIKRQAKSSTFLRAVAKALALLNHEDIIHELLEYNHTRYGITIPYQFYREKFAMLSKASTSLDEDRTPPSGSSVKAEDILDPKLAAMVKCYEDNINLVTPMIFERLKDIADTYPEGWFEKAIEETVTSGKKSLKYTEAILERWKAEGVKPLSLKRSRAPSKPVEEEE